MEAKIFDKKDLKDIHLTRKRAADMAGYYLQSVLEQYGKPFEDFSWCKYGDMISETDDISFLYKNQLFSVLVLVYNNGEEFWDEYEKKDERRKKRFIENCKINNLIPCYFPINIKLVKENRENEEKNVKFTFDIPKETEWNLFDARDNSPINPIEMATDELIELSEYEKTIGAFHIAKKYIEKMNIKNIGWWNEYSPIMLGKEEGRQITFIIKSISEEEYNNIKNHDYVAINIENKRGYENLIHMQQIFFGIKYNSKYRAPKIYYKYIYAPVTKIESWSYSNTLHFWLDY